MNAKSGDALRRIVPIVSGRRAIAPAVVVGVALLAGLVFVISSRHTAVRNPTGAVVQRGGPAFDPIRSDEIESILPQDAIPALIKPNYLSAAEASDINNREEVIGVVINGDARAYPISTMSSHEIVDDDIGGQPIAVTW
jgi:hypothetical protein